MVFHLPAYAGFVQRLGRLAPALSVLLERLTHQFPHLDHHTYVLDSVPILLAQGPRRFKTKVARELAGPGYSPPRSSITMASHAIAWPKPVQAAYPSLQSLSMTSAQCHDLNAVPELPARQTSTSQIFADKAYQGADKILDNPIWYLPLKKPKGQKYVDAADKLLTTAIARVRQPIGSFFNWLQETTGIQIASKARSTNGLLAHVFGRLCAAFINWKAYRYLLRRIRSLWH